MLRITTTFLVIVLGASAVFGETADQQPTSREKTPSADATALAERAVEVDWALPSFRIGGATRGSWLPALYVSLAGLQAVDAYNTSKGLSRGASEANPTMRPFAGNAAAMLAVKGGATAVTIAVAERLWRKNRRGRAIAVAIVANSVLASVAAHNAAVLRAQR